VELLLLRVEDGVGVGGGAVEAGEQQEVGKRGLGALRQLLPAQSVQGDDRACRVGAGDARVGGGVGEQRFGERYKGEEPAVFGSGWRVAVG